MLLLTGVVVVVVTNHTHIYEINIFAVVLAEQRLPFLAAVGIAALDGSRFNEFAYWRGLSGLRTKTQAASGQDLLMRTRPSQVLTPEP